MSWLRRLRLPPIRRYQGRHRLTPGRLTVEECLAKAWLDRVHATPEDPTLLRAALTMPLPCVEADSEGR